MELVYVRDSKSRFCGFESHPGHHDHHPASEGQCHWGLESACETATEIANSVQNSTVYSPLSRHCAESSHSDTLVGRDDAVRNEHMDRATTQFRAQLGDGVAGHFQLRVGPVVGQRSHKPLRVVRFHYPLPILGV